MVALVTVVFEPEVRLLELQAQSLARFAPLDLAAEIVVIDNTLKGLSGRVRGRLLDAYGPLNDRVRWLRPDEVVSGPLPSVSGWILQQILKLEVAAVLSQPWYVALDAKNAAIAPLDEAVFFSADGRAKMGRHTYRGHPLESRVAHILASVGADPALIDDFPVTHTPVTLNTEQVRALTGSMRSRGSGSFAEAFVAEAALEFPLYSAALSRNGALDRLYSREVVQTPALWRRSAHRAGVAAFAGRVEESETRFIALHRSAVVRLGPLATLQLASVLASTGLFRTQAAAWLYLTRCQLALVRAKVGAKVRARGRTKVEPHRR